MCPSGLHEASGGRCGWIRRQEPGPDQPSPYRRGLKGSCLPTRPKTPRQQCPCLGAHLRACRGAPREGRGDTVRANRTTEEEKNVQGARKLRLLQEAFLD